MAQQHRRSPPNTPLFGGSLPRDDHGKEVTASWWTVCSTTHSIAQHRAQILPLQHCAWTLSAFLPLRRMAIPWRDGRVVTRCLSGRTERAVLLCAFLIMVMIDRRVSKAPSPAANSAWATIAADSLGGICASAKRRARDGRRSAEGIIRCAAGPTSRCVPTHGPGRCRRTTLVQSTVRSSAPYASGVGRLARGDANR